MNRAMMLETRIPSSVVLLAAALLVGCGTTIPPEPPPSGSPATPAPASAAAPDAEVEAAAESAEHAPQQPAMADSSEGPELAPPGQARTEEAEPAGDRERVKAERGVGAKGRSLDEHSGVIVTAAKAFFSVRERAVFDIQIPQAVQLYKATHGRGPQSHDDFMTQIVEANQIQLPELHGDHRYVYDPQTEQLMVERPVR